MTEQTHHHTNTTESQTTSTERASPWLLRYGLLGLSMALLLIVGALLFVLDGVESEAESADFSANDTQLADILFLGPADAARVDLFRLNPNTGAMRRLTDTEGGVLEYAISPSGEWVAYSVQVTGHIADIWALNLQTGQELQLTNCRESNASCTHPSWRYDDVVVAYTRRELDADSGWENTERVWLVDLAGRETQPLFDDVETTARFPVWSPTEERIAMSLIDPPGIVVYDMPSDEIVFVASPQGVTGRFTEDGQALLYPATRYGEAVQYYYTHIEMISFGDDFSEESSHIRRISGETSTPATDGQAVVHPDGEWVAVTRRYLDERFTEGSQIYLLSLEDDSIEPMIVDEDYAHASLNWSADGSKLLYQRTNLSDYREIDLWLYDMETGTSTRIHESGFMPRFLHD